MIEPATIRLRVDPTNPGQFLACCGLLELAGRLWPGVEASFDASTRFFRILSPAQGISLGTLIQELVDCELANAMSIAQVRRREDLAALPKSERDAPSYPKAEKDALDKMWREAAIELRDPFRIRVDWFLDGRAGGDDFKTWAGQQSVFDIARGMKSALDASARNSVPPEDWLIGGPRIGRPPFNFDSDLGALGSDRDIGFSCDPLQLTVQARPRVELLAFIGLQRFRPTPSRAGERGCYQFAQWLDPLPPEVASAAACGLLDLPKSQAFEFRLLYRTKYLKSFLPAKPIGGVR